MLSWLILSACFLCCDKQTTLDQHIHSDIAKHVCALFRRVADAESIIADGHKRLAAAERATAELENQQQCLRSQLPKHSSIGRTGSTMVSAKTFTHQYVISNFAIGLHWNARIVKHDNIKNNYNYNDDDDDDDAQSVTRPYRRNV